MASIDSNRSPIASVIQVGCVVALHIGLIYLLNLRLIPADAPSQLVPLVYLNLAELPPERAPASTLPAVPTEAVRTNRQRDKKIATALPIVAPEPSPDLVGNNGVPAPNTATTTTIDTAAIRQQILAHDRQNPRDDLRRLGADFAHNSNMEKQLGAGIRAAVRPDCLHDYAGAGLLAPLPLLFDLVRGKPCKL